MFICLQAFSQERLPGVFTYQGRAYQTDGTTALTGPATFLVQIRSGNGNCLLYQESHAGVDLTASNGFFALNIGDGTSKSGLDVTSVFSNINQPKATLGGTCGGAYTPANQEGRVLRVTVNSIQLDDQFIYAVPQALVADSLNGYTFNQFAIYNSITGRFNRFNGASWEEVFKATSLGTGSSIYKGKTASSDQLEFRSLVGGNGISVTQNTNDITLSIDPSYTQRRVVTTTLT